MLVTTVIGELVRWRETLHKFSREALMRIALVAYARADADEESPRLLVLFHLGASFGRCCLPHGFCR